MAAGAALAPDLVVSAVRHHVKRVLGGSAIGKVRRRVVAGVTVQMADPQAIRTRPQEGERDQLVHCVTLPVEVHVRVASRSDPGA